MTNHSAKNHRLVTAATSMCISLVIAGTGVLSTPASATTYGSPLVLFAGRGVEVVQVLDAKTQCPNVYLTTDFTHWHNVTPLRPQAKVRGQCIYYWGSAAFTSPRVGWLLARNGGSTNTILVHTLNGGRSWTIQPGGWTGSNGGSEVIGFINAQLGWRQQFAAGSNRPYVLQHTTNGGTKWTNVHEATYSGCALLPYVFATKSIGFAAAPLMGAVASDTFNSSYIWRTSNGGATWSKMTVRASKRPSVPMRTIYGQPSFVGADGTLPVVTDAVGTNSQIVHFFTTTDGGKLWTLANSVGVSGRLSFSTPVDDGCGSSPSITGPLVSVSIASPSTWWVLRPGLKGGTAVVRGTGGGNVQSVVTSAAGLPATTHGASLVAVDAMHALLTLGVSSGSLNVYFTNDGGRIWSQLTASSL